MAILRVHVIPNAKTDCVVGEFPTASPSRGGHAGSIKVKLRAPAVEGKANAALVRFLAEQMKLPLRAVVLKSGQRSRDKLIRIDGLNEAEVRTLLRAISPGGAELRDASLRTGCRSGCQAINCSRPLRWTPSKSPNC